MEAQAQGTQCGTGRKQRPGLEEALAPGPRGVSTKLAVPGWLECHPLPTAWESLGPCPRRASAGRGAAHPRPHRVPHRLRLKTGRPWAGPQGGGRGALCLGWAGRLGAGSSALPLCCLRGGWGSPRRHYTQGQPSSEVSVRLRQRDRASPDSGALRASAGQDRRLSLAVRPGKESPSGLRSTGCGAGLTRGPRRGAARQ